MKWPEYHLSQLADRFISGGTPSTKVQEYWDGNIPWITGADFSDGQVILGRRYINQAAVDNSATNIVPKGSILMVTRTGVGKIAIAPVDIAISQDITGIVLKQGVDGKFVIAAIRNRMSIVLAAQRGATIKGVTRKDIENLSIPLPSASEQRRIVEILDQADALRKKRAEADARAARILPALFYKMFGDPLALMLSDDAVPLGQMEVHLQNGFACGEKDVEGGIPHLRMNNIDDAGVINLDLVRTVPEDRDEERYRLQVGDVLFMGTNSEDKIGKTCLFIPPDNRHYLFSNHLLRIRVRDVRITAEYLSAFLHLLWSKRFYPSIAKRWVNQASISQDAFSSVGIPIPTQAKLRSFTEAFNQLLGLRLQRAETSTLLDMIFQSLLHQAFTGDLTAKWREAHMKELLAEMDAQARALECPSAASNPPEVKSKRHAGHDMFNKAVLAAYITDRCHAPDRPVGRVKLAKLFYLVQKNAEIELSETFMKRAAGPLDDEIHKFLSLAQKNKWLVLGRGQGDLKPVSPGANVSKAVEQAQKLLGSAKAKVDELLDQMKIWGYRALERWATVLEASLELAAAGQPATVEGVKSVIQKHPDWVRKLDREEFSDSNIDAALRGLRGFGFIPTQNQVYYGQ